VEHCGNGARCFVKFVTARGLTDKRTVRVEVMSGIATLTMQDDGQVTVDMGAPVFEAARLPFLPEGLLTRTEGDDTLHALQI
ncbi:diaminopimelate epimerase, partial [Vibrio fortis]